MMCPVDQGAACQGKTLCKWGWGWDLTFSELKTWGIGSKIKTISLNLKASFS